MKSKIGKFLIILLIAVLLAPPSYAKGDDEDHGPPKEMVYLMYAMMLTAAVWIIYNMTTGGPRHMGMDEFQKNYHPVSLEAGLLPLSAKTEPFPQKEKVELVVFNYTF